MAYIYASTDSSELEKLIDPHKKESHIYNDLEIVEVNPELQERIGFMPMSSAEIKGMFSIKELRHLAENLVKAGLFAAVESGGRIDTYIPEDLLHRNKILSISLSNKFGREYGIGLSDAAFNLILYSNNPNAIREF